MINSCPRSVISWSGCVLLSQSVLSFSHLVISNYKKISFVYVNCDPGQTFVMTLSLLN